MIKVTVDQINNLLPQTQCQRCGFEGCEPYAKAILNGTPHNQCPPGGQRLIDELSELLDRDKLALNPENGQEGPRLLARIRENECIGCTKCIQACPVDAIVGTGKMMHTVIASECTGCELCISPCPVDCIELVQAPDNQQPSKLPETERKAKELHHRQRYLARNRRLAELKELESQKYHQNKLAAKTPGAALSLETKKAAIQAAIARAKQKKHTPSS